MREEEVHAPVRSRPELDPGAVGMQVDVFAFVEVERDKIGADAAAAIRRVLEAGGEPPPRAVGVGGVGEKVGRRARGRGRAQREDAGGEGAQRASPGSKRPHFSTAVGELPGQGASILQRCDNFFKS